MPAAVYKKPLSLTAVGNAVEKENIIDFYYYSVRKIKKNLYLRRIIVTIKIITFR